MFHIPPSWSCRWLVTLAATFAAWTGIVWLLAPALHVLLSSQPVQSLDRSAWQFVHALGVPALMLVAGVSNQVHGTVGILLLAVVTSWLLWLTGRREACMRMLVALPAGMVLNIAVKALIDRARPSWAVVDLPVSASFPSGHVAEATVFYGSLAIEFVRHQMDKLRTLAVVGGALAMIAIVAFSRIVVGVHFLSDCLGALVESAFWLAVCFSSSPLANRSVRAEVQ